MTGVTDKQVEELGISVTPMHPETELRRVGVLLKAKQNLEMCLQTIRLLMMRKDL